MADKSRAYPACCLSMHCGKYVCTGCRNEPVLKEFEEWRDRTGAVCNPYSTIYYVPKN